MIKSEFTVDTSLLKAEALDSFSKKVFIFVFNYRSKMTANQTFRLFQIANKYFKNEDDSRSFVSEIEGVVENKFENKATGLSTKEDLQNLEKSTKEDIRTLELSIKTLGVKMEQGFKNQLKWLIILMLGFSSLIITIVKIV